MNTQVSPADADTNPLTQNRLKMLLCLMGMRDGDGDEDVGFNEVAEVWTHGAQLEKNTEEKALSSVAMASSGFQRFYRCCLWSVPEL